MTDTKPQIASLQPTVLPDNRRITFEIVVTNLPPMINAFFTMPDTDDATSPSTDPDSDKPSPYPNVELSVLNSRRQQIASLFIVEHKEEQVALTLHIPDSDPHAQYIARAEMVYQDETIDVIETPFTLNTGEQT
jgi:hypothetical protein